MDFELEYAKSNRSMCKGCKSKIDKGALRIGAKAKIDPDKMDDSMSYAMASVQWYHFQCFPKMRKAKWFEQNLPPASDCAGYDALQAEDAERATALFNLCRGQDAELPAQSGTKRKAETSELTAAEKLAKLTEVGRGAFTKEQFAAFNGHKAELAKKNAAQLGAMLANNGLAKSGRKDELLERIAECRVLGALPTCPTCNKGRLKWARESGVYSCPGYFDDELKRNVRCKGPPKDAVIERPAWKELEL